MPVPLFVYGTLKRRGGRRRHDLLRGARFVAPASMAGELYDLGEYPGVVRNSSTRRRVFGELYELPEAVASNTLRALDVYEGDEFARERVYITTARGKRRKAWVYVLRERPRAEYARPVASGRYHRGKGAA